MLYEWQHWQNKENKNKHCVVITVFLLPALQTGCRGSPGCVNLSQHRRRAFPLAECSLPWSFLIWRQHLLWCTRPLWQKKKKKQSAKLRKQLCKLLFVKSNRENNVNMYICTFKQYVCVLPIFVQGHLIAINILGREFVYWLGTLPVSHLSTLQKGEERKLHKTGVCGKM